jgi:hypothetical protein
MFFAQDLPALVSLVVAILFPTRTLVVIKEFRKAKSVNDKRKVCFLHLTLIIADCSGLICTLFVLVTVVRIRDFWNQVTTVRIFSEFSLLVFQKLQGKK